MNQRWLRLVWRLGQPGLLVGSVGLAFLGLGIARYLGETIAPEQILPGLGWLIGLELGGATLWAYLESLLVPSSPILENAVGTVSQREKSLLRAISLICFTLSAFWGYWLLRMNANSVLMLSMLLGGALLAVLFSLPPVRLETSGFGELGLAVGVGTGIPLLFFVLATGELNRLVAISTGMIPFLILATLIVFQLSTYARDIKYNRQRLMIRLGWETSLGLHSALLFFGFVWIGAAMWLGLPRSVGLPVFFVLPLVVVQLFLLQHIEEGAKPNWLALQSISIAIVAGVIYLLGFGFWIR